jgi:hypothetical protein
LTQKLGESRAALQAQSDRVTLKLNLGAKIFDAVCSSSSSSAYSLPFGLAILPPFDGHFPLWG